MTLEESLNQNAINGGRNMICKNCGKEISDSAVVCSYCGCATDNISQATSTSTTGQPNGITEQMKANIAKKGKYKAAVVLTIIGWVLLAIFLGVLIYCLCNMHVFQEDNPIAYAFLLPFVFEACFIASFFLNGAYRSANKNEGIGTGKLCTFVYVITIIGLIPLLPLLLVGIVYFLFNAISNKIASIPPSSSSTTDQRDKKYTIRDERGYLRDIEWDQYTKTYRDSSGNHYKTDDNGQTFTRK